MGTLLKKLPPGVRSYLLSVILAGSTIALAAILYSVMDFHLLTSGSAISFAVLIILAVVGERLAIPLISYDHESTTHTIGSVANIAAILVLPWYLAILVACISLTLGQFRLSKEKLAFNVAYTAIQVGAAALVFLVFHGHDAMRPGGPLIDIHALGILVLVSVAYYVMGTALVAKLLSMLSGDNLMSTLKATHLKTSLQEGTSIGLGLMLGGFWVYNPAFAPFVILPVVMAYFSIDTFVRIQEETRHAVLAMSESIDHRDPLTYNHSKRVAKLSVALAEEIALSHEQLATIELSALVHDIGKIGISSDILMKPGKLTQEERLQMELHPVIGYDMLRHYKQFRKGLGIVRWHHETWDGTGYPDKLPGPNIPLEARIVSICDAYEAMTADRPYRKAMSAAIAMSRLEAGAGTQFDPDLVPAFRRASERIGEPVSEPLEQETVSAPEPKREPEIILAATAHDKPIPQLGRPTVGRPQRRQGSRTCRRTNPAIMDASS